MYEIITIVKGKNMDAVLDTLGMNLLIMENKRIGDIIHSQLRKKITNIKKTKDGENLYLV